MKATSTTCIAGSFIMLIATLPVTTLAASQERVKSADTKVSDGDIKGSVQHDPQS
jgi:hypothetical protein